MMRLQGALDTEIHVATQRFLQDGVSADVPSIYTAIQKSNSSLKRKPKKLLQASIERVLDFMGVQDSEDSEAVIEQKQSKAAPDVDMMNKSLRANLATPFAPQTAQRDGIDEDGTRKRRMANGEPISKRHKSDKVSTAPPTDLSLDDIGGMDDVILQLKTQLGRPILYPQSYARMKLKVPKGILLHGPPGCGKTMLSRACAAELGVAFIEITGPSIVSGVSGESEKAVRDRFDEAKKNAPCVMFLDEIDAIAPKRETSQSQMEKRIVAQLLTCMDELDRDPSKPVIVLAATNRPDSLDPALRRGGRFDTEINIGVPNEQTRAAILAAQTRESPIAADVDFKRLAKMTAGFVGADLHDLVSKAGSRQLDLLFEALETAHLQPNGDVEAAEERPTSSAAVKSFRHLVRAAKGYGQQGPPTFDDATITMAAFEAVLPGITPSSKREGFATIPDVSWDDIGALKPVREQLEMAIVRPIKEPERFAAVGIDTPTGVLLWGPPGCGKTLLAKAVAAESRANFISVKGPELLNKFVGESEAAVRRVFTRARSSVPCIIFFDELDALVPRRDDAGSEASNRVVNTLLTELDGLEERAGIYVIAATNRPDVVDEAMLRPGRLDTPLFVDLPGDNERVDILKTLLRKRKHEFMPEIENIVRQDCKGFSGADLKALLREAGNCAIRRETTKLEAQDFRHASSSIKASVGDIDRYRKLRNKFGHR